MITWWDPLSEAHPSASAVSAGSLDETVCPKAAKLHFLIESQDGLTSRLAQRRSIKSVYFTGPYGQNLHLDNYENVILVAQGIGIAGILPYALHLSKRRFHRNTAYQRGLATRRVDIFWLLEENSQENWASEYLSLLQSMDKEKVRMPPINMHLADIEEALAPNLVLLSGEDDNHTSDNSQRPLQMHLWGENGLHNPNCDKDSS
jgi:hypothetical protein